MGLTIGYTLTTNRTELATLRALVASFRQSAKQLPFQDVGDIVEFRDTECRFDDPGDADRWLKIQAGQYVTIGARFIKVTPLHVIAFTTFPGEGSEPANFGLARFPEFVEMGDGSTRVNVPTNLSGWQWRSFCKTQFASNPAHGGVANFVRCHLSIVALLDAIQKRQLAQVEVNDESGYWTFRDVRKLAETVGTWNEMIADIVGQFNDAGDGHQVESPITEFANFEQLEARGQARRKNERP